MSTAIINIRTSEELKNTAQSVASELGLTLTTVVEGLLRNFVTERRITFGPREIPSDYLIESLRKSEEDRKAGRVISFKNVDQAVGYLDRMIERDERAGKN